jgi:hypothetical protein
MFDYRLAHKEVAAPLYRALPKRVHTLVARVKSECADLTQKPDLDMPWPEGLREAFEALDTNTLAHAAWAVYFFGHWGTRDCLQEFGTYWKFSNYCDQVLRARLGLKQDAPDRGVGFVVCEGQLRVCYSSARTWTWTEIGPASLGLLRSARRRFGKGMFLLERYQKAIERQLRAQPVETLADYGA